MDHDTSVRRRIWWYLACAAAVAVVILSWRVPEPEQSSPNPAQRIQPISYTQCAKQEAPPPSYGTRGLVNTTCMQ